MLIVHGFSSQGEFCRGSTSAGAKAAGSFIVQRNATVLFFFDGQLLFLSGNSMS